MINLQHNKINGKKCVYQCRGEKNESRKKQENKLNNLIWRQFQCEFQ